MTKLARRPKLQPIQPAQPLLQTLLVPLRKAFALLSISNIDSPTVDTLLSNAGKSTLKDTFNSTIIKELLKRVYTFLNKQRLISLNNFD